MLIPIGKMRSGEKTPLSFSEMLAIPTAYGLTDDAVNAAVRGILEREGDDYSFKGEVSATIHAECGLCLAPVAKELNFQVDEKFSETLDSLGTEEVWKIDSKNIDLSDAMLSALLMEIPARFVCSADCKGLCPVCGADLNQTRCDCITKQTDERFAQLKALFKEV